MKLQLFLVIFAAFVLGMLATALLNEVTFASASPEQLSPASRVSENQIQIFSDHVAIQIPNVQWASFTDTNSMDPLLDVGAHGLQIIPSKKSDIHVGDIITYKYDTERIIHRVVYISQDSKGWYCIVKGDNNKVADPGKVRFKQIDRLLIGILY